MQWNDMESEIMYGLMQRHGVMAVHTGHGMPIAVSIENNTADPSTSA